jgi:succinate dehydrogenase/fumarate reductase flavoprotein subunit
MTVTEHPFSAATTKAHETYDVVVVGAGVAGLRAAIAAAETGARTLLVSTSPPDATTSAIAWGAASGAVGGMNVSEYAALLTDKAQQAGDAALQRLLAEETAQRLEELRRFGVPLIVGHGHVRVQGPYSRPALNMVEPLRRFAAELGVEMRFGWTAVGVGRRAPEGRIAGLLLWQGGALQPVQAGAVVLCGGGYAGLFPRHDNLGGHVGDCLALGLLAGAHVADMEFCIFQPPGLAEEGRRMDSIYGRPLWQAGRWRTLDGRALSAAEVWEYLRARAASTERLDERYDLLCDLSGLTAEDWLTPELARARREFLPDWPLEHRPIRISPLAHYTLGGLVIDEEGGTGVAGLFAAGECTALFGAGRPGGAALASCLVFGTRAGEAGARHARHAEPASAATWLALKPLPSALAAELRAEASWALWNYASLFKHAAGLARARQWLGQLTQRLQQAPLPTPAQAVSYQAAAALPLAWAVVLASEARRETRGEHRRLDFPNPAPDFAGRRVVFEAAALHLQAVAVSL